MRKFKCDIPLNEEVEMIEEQLMAYNLKIKPMSQEQPYISINRCIKDESGKVVGGIIATSVLWHILYIDTIWVDENVRKCGLGTQLLKEIEHEAQLLGCKISHLSTFDFQGKDFYLKNGYEVFGILNDSPKGHQEFFMTKRL
jgi:GNAT superfamily N-acetyltransferase